MIIRIATLVLLFNAGTYFLGWWSVPLIAAVYALFRQRKGVPLEAATGALIGWLHLFLIQSMNPAFSILLRRLDGLFPVPPLAVMAIMVLFSALFAWSASRVVLGFTGVRTD